MINLTGQFRVLRAANTQTSNILLYKHPSTKNVRGYYQISTYDENNNFIEKLSFQNIRRLVDAHKIFNYVMIYRGVKSV